MELSINPGKYVVAVSGGVDSVTLLDILSHQPGAELVIAHFNHGIRSDSDKDEELVAKLAENYGLPLEIGRANLGPAASEAQARQARHNFLKSVQNRHKADFIITAHHEDDLVETALINILRGTGPRGLAAPTLNPNIVRPLFRVSKKDIYKYAKEHNLTWREDYTNEEEKYLRNYLRLKIIPKLTAEQKRTIIKNIDIVAKNIEQQEKIIATLSRNTINESRVDRSRFSLLPTEVATNLLIFWCRQQGLRNFDSRLIYRVNELIRTGSAGSRHDLTKDFALSLTKTEAKLTTKDGGELI